MKSQYLPFEIKSLHDLGYFSDLDYYFARSMKRISHTSDPIVIASCALMSKMVAHGHICIDISQLGNQTIPVSEQVSDRVSQEGDLFIRLPESIDWLNRLTRSELVSNDTDNPLVLKASGRLYLAKFYDFQQRLINNIVTRIKDPGPEVDADFMESILKGLFQLKSKGVDDQKAAVKKTVLNRFSVITGGPGTGKTFITSSIRQVFSQMAQLKNEPSPRILCVAPTGKAASKMDQGQTIHRVLKPHRNRPGFYHSKTNPLLVDVIIVDEASMIDLVLMTHLFEALPSTAHVVLIGDRHQLASVQAGSIFSDICESEPMQPFIHHLSHVFRSGDKSGIQSLARAINKNDQTSVEKILGSNQFPDVLHHPAISAESATRLIEPIILQGYRKILGADTSAKALKNLNDFRILCAHNSGQYGTLPINHFCENILRSMSNSDIQNRLFKRVIMITANDYKNELFNGDTGIVSDSDDNQTVCFKRSDGRVKQVRYSQLPGHETAFAITVHKAQGSEFDTVLLLIPDKLSPVLTRQLLYTGVTRARKHVIIVGNLGMINAAMDQDTTRFSGVGEELSRALS